MERKPLIAGNWKMNLDHMQAVATVQKLAFALPAEYYEKVDVAVTVPFTDLRSVQTVIDGDKLQITYGAQDVSEHESGAYTGEISAAMLAKLGCTWVVVGHSERREYHGESSKLVAAKAKAALSKDISPIVCVGEPLTIREAGTHVDFVVEQTRESLAGLTEDELAKTVIAYEPVWAIGTGKVASAADAQEVCKAIRGLIKELANEKIAAGIRILYGGSVKEETVAEIVGQPDVDGGLVGGASLDGEAFAKLAANAATGL
ncbi:triose-phosphate isomerase [Corynebacterium pseudotuberculosis]|uniref:Triosephosphate isomerase n=1 Tax=Corynebacterium pseudotuberculosis 258 TaxID=1168865 RepID=A0AAU8PYE0_CORPS|nr:triose-phosphate isomerase [Corynebacterium pseudotuberculosis]AER69156.1 Triosephosphate isomerase [Corynebacterium pseudotuberculosis 1/06-A]ADK28901.1 triose-phosphate isomerase [Corynebacterium pseudotuberculosis FRC41]ADL20989.1 triose-phosphate isomerase [Corynebacterium pseudotuberculosis 1002]AEQ06659.1 triose-phosphate isomerase [Corynebacterium pseudotuberculosis CIP 52.97]AEX39593.1 Triosephosphate isomerase [Corynebacterium pseudotuberculosis 3/99-5]